MAPLCLECTEKGILVVKRSKARPPLAELISDLVARLIPYQPAKPQPRGKGGRKVIPDSVLIPEILEKLRTGDGWSVSLHTTSGRRRLDSIKASGGMETFWAFIKDHREDLGWTEGELKAASLWLYELKYRKKHEATKADLNWLESRKSKSAFKKDKDEKRWRDKRRKKPAEETCQEEPKPAKKKRDFIWREAYWTVPDALWTDIIAPIIAIFHPISRVGSPRSDLRRLLNGMIWQLRTSAHWREVPREFGHRNTITKWRNRMEGSGCLDAILEAIKVEAERLQLIDYTTQAIDGCKVKSRRGGEACGPNYTDRGKGGVMRSLLVDGNGMLLSVAITGANTPEADMLDETIRRALKPSSGVQGGYFLIDRGYRSQECRDIIERAGYTYVPPERNGGDVYALAEAEATKLLRRGRWVVERSHSWLNQYRALLVRYGYKAQSYRAGLKVAGILSWWRRIEDARAKEVK